MKKCLILIICLILPITLLKAQKNNAKEALLLIDIQNFYFKGGSSELVNPIPASLNAKKILEYFRENEKLVIHVKHGSGDAAKIHNNVKPLESEKIIIKNEVNSFKNTELLDFLKKNKIESLVICGMQTHMCLEGATRAASDYDFKCTVIQDACATKDVKFGNKTIKAEDVHFSTLGTISVYAKVTSTLEFLKKNR
jgi:nicotinamidase-related amidase